MQPVCAAVKYCLNLKDRIPKNSLLPEIVFVHIMSFSTLGIIHTVVTKIYIKICTIQRQKNKNTCSKKPWFHCKYVYLSLPCTFGYKNVCLNVISALFPFGCKQHCTAHEVGPGRLRMVSFTCTCGKKIMIKMEKRYSFWKRWKKQPHNALVRTCVCKSPTRVRVSKETWPKNESQIKWVF